MSKFNVKFYKTLAEMLSYLGLITSFVGKELLGSFFNVMLLCTFIIITFCIIQVTLLWDED